ncbi:MAG: aldehyde dehydrogenase family protein, partial [Actinomycetota bacterium]
GWSARPAGERAAYLAAIADGLERRSEDLATTMAREVGTPIERSRRVQVGLPITVFRTMADIAASPEPDEQIGHSTIVREPVGVVGAVTPWNYPLYQLAAKAAAALAAGCTVVAKPPQVAPLSALALAEVCAEVGLPPGVFNLVCGEGRVVGEAIAAHPGIDMVSFTGSTAAGARFAAVAAGTVKRVALELGGKSACVVLDDADLPTAIQAGVASCYLNNGQTCVAQTRLLVPRTMLGAAEDLVVGAAERYVCGNPLDPATTLGPLASAHQRDTVRDLIRQGRDEGARLLVGGEDPPDGPPQGYFVRPTVFSEVRSAMTIAQEEIFGPVLSLMAYDDEDDAVRIANDSRYGLSGAVWAGTRERAQRVARRLRTGQVAVNGGAFNPLAPFGGYKQSGIGRELGRYGVAEYVELKAIQA